MFKFDTSVHSPRPNVVNRVLDTYDSVLNNIINRAGAIQEIQQKEEEFPLRLKQFELENESRKLGNNFLDKTMDDRIESTRLANDELDVAIKQRKQDYNFERSFMNQMTDWATSGSSFFSRMNPYKNKSQQDATATAPPPPPSENTQQQGPREQKALPEGLPYEEPPIERKMGIRQVEDVLSSSEPISRKKSTGANITVYGSKDDKTPDTLTGKGYGAFGNVLVPGESVALSRDLAGKAKPGDAVYIDNKFVGYFDDKTAKGYGGKKIHNTVDILDKGGELEYGMWNNPGEITFGPGRKPVKYSKELARGYGFQI